MIHTHGYKADVYGYRASRNVSRPIVATCHNWCEDSARLRLYAALDRWTLRRFSRVIAVSAAVAARLERAGVPRRRISLIDNGVDLEAFASAVPDFAKEIGKGSRLLIGMVARLVPEKGCFDLVKVARTILEKCPEALFVFIGDGPARSGLESLARELGVADSILFAGQRSDMPSIYASLDIFVLPSLNEGMPMSILEAMAARKPVIATRVGAVEKLVTPGETGLLVSAGDVAGLAQAIETLATNESLRVRLGKRAQAKVTAQYSAAAMAERYIRIYEELIGTRVTVAYAASQKGLR
jgi:glycosyltransferase involved in cell wall biosynthesis